MTDHKSSFIKDFCIGGTAGCISKLLFHTPFDSASMIITYQTLKPDFTYDQRYKGFIDCMIRVTKDEGIFRLWKDTSWYTLSQLPKYGIRFTIYNNFKSNDDRLGRNLIAGGLAGLTYSSIECLYFKKSKKDIYNIGGEENSYKKQAFHNFKISIGLKVFYDAFYFGGYDLAKSVFLKDTKENGQYNSISNFFKRWLIAHCTTVTANILSTPFDTVRRRMIIQFSNPFYKSSFDCLKTIVTKEGIYSLFRGASIKIFRSRGGLALVIYDEIQKLFIKTNIPNKNNYY